MIKKIYLDDNEFKNNHSIVTCIGYFDGVHLGHQALIKETVSLAKLKNLVPALITFDPDPSDVILKTKNKHINSLNRRIDLYEQFGIKEVYIIKFNEQIMNLEPDVFIDKYLVNLNIETIICGFDFKFGKKASGNYTDLAKYFNTKVIPEVKYYGLKISSTRILKELNKGNIKKAERMLGYDYQ